MKINKEQFSEYKTLHNIKEFIVFVFTFLLITFFSAIIYLFGMLVNDKGSACEEHIFLKNILLNGLGSIIIILSIFYFLICLWYAIRNLRENWIKFKEVKK